MGRQRNKANKRKAAARASVPPDYAMLSCNILDFANTALWVQQEIQRQKISDNPQDVRLTVDGARPHVRWSSMAAVAHFNVGRALELMLKFLLQRNGKSYPPGYQGHLLAFLHNKLPQLVKERIEDTYQEMLGGKSLVFYRLIRNDVPLPASTDNQKVTSFQSLLAFLDKDAKLAEKSYELCDPERQGQWRYFVGDIAPLVQVVRIVMDQVDSYTQPTEGGEQENQVA
ncbi:MAG: hypothetical protein OXI53_00900 [Nitrospira sp.]|nr:hypothetical protein [Nitrospira sp.]MDE0485677.1 hypothetical protein [Nitrospira sp.]